MEVFQIGGEGGLEIGADFCAHLGICTGSFTAGCSGAMLLLPESGGDEVFGAGTTGGSALGVSAFDGLDFGKPVVGVERGFVNRLLIIGFAGTVGLLSGAFAGDAGGAGLTVIGVAATAGPGGTAGFCDAIAGAGDMFNGWLSHGGAATVDVGGAVATTDAGGDVAVGGMLDIAAGFVGLALVLTGTDDLG